MTFTEGSSYSGGSSHERAGAGLEEEQQHDGYYYDAVGRRRKLAAGAMKAIQREFEAGVSARELGERYGVSSGLVLTICYFTPKGAPLRRPDMPDQKPVGWGDKQQEAST
jgi:hypothetical protein